MPEDLCTEVSLLENSENGRDKAVADTSRADVHLGNVLIRLPSSLNKLTVEQLYGAFGEPCTERIERLDGQPLPPGVPRYGTVPAWLGKKSNEIALNEAHILLSDFGEAFSPSNPQQTKNRRPMLFATACLTARGLF